MGNRAEAGTCVATLVKMAVPLLQQAERLCPRTGPGAKPVYPDWWMAALIMIAVLHKKKTKSAQYRFLESNQELVFELLGGDRLPVRSRYCDRYLRAWKIYRVAIRLQGERAVAEGIAEPRHLVVDKSLLKAQGRVWHQRDRKKGKRPAGADPEASWTWSEHHDWVYGYSYEIVVTARGNTVFPLLASVGTASASEVRTFADKIDELPAQARTISADSGYDCNQYGEQIEYDARGRRTGRRFLCPGNPRNTKGRKLKPASNDRQARSRQRRQQRQKFLKSPVGRRIYARRSKTVEPFNEWLKGTFELNNRVWHRGLANNQTQMLAAIFSYQLLVRYNHRRGNHNGRVRWLLDAL